MSVAVTACIKLEVGSVSYLVYALHVSEQLPKKVFKAVFNYISLIAIVLEAKQSLAQCFQRFEGIIIENGDSRFPVGDPSSGLKLGIPGEFFLRLPERHECNNILNG